MKFVWYSLLKKGAWHCLKCLSTASDNLQLVPAQKDKYLIELFSGSKTVALCAQNDFNYRTLTVDNNPKLCPSICKDILNLAINNIPERKKVFIVWASLPCTYYSVLNIKDHWQKMPYSHRQYFYIPQSDSARAAVKLLEKTLWIIRTLNPVYYFIENPRGALRHMPQMKSIPYLHTVSYADYDMDIYKPTDIFTNYPGLRLEKLLSCVGKKFTRSVAKMNNAYERSLVPVELIRAILGQVEQRHFISATGV